MSNTEIVNETADIDDIELHEVYVLSLIHI